LPEKYADYLGLVAATPTGKWDEEAMQGQIKKYDRSMLRSLTSEFENIEAAIKHGNKMLEKILTSSPFS